MNKFVYSFNEGSKEMRNLLGTKGASLAEMMQIGLPVPFGFTVTTQACEAFYENGCKISEEIEAEIFEKIAELESVTGKTFGGGQNPLLVSVRCGAACFVPGLAETILNLGINDKTADTIGKLTGDRKFAEDSYKLFLRTYGQAMERAGEAAAAPQDAGQQLLGAVRAAFLAWGAQEPSAYRSRNRIDPEAACGVAVSVQAMAFGNLGADSAVGIATTRDCLTGESRLTGGFALRTIGEHGLADGLAPKTQCEAGKAGEMLQDLASLAERFPKAYESLQKIAGILERHYSRVQRMEFAIQENKLYILQAEEAELTPEAELKIAVDMASEDLINRKTAILRQNPENMARLAEKAGSIASGDNSQIAANYAKLMEWIDEFRELKVRVNADSSQQAREAARLGAEGIGLCRTENLIRLMGEMPLLEELLRTASGKERAEKLHILKASMRRELEAIFCEMGENPVTIRLLDLPVTLRDVTAMQTEAIIEAAQKAKEATEGEIKAEILVPMISTVAELQKVKAAVLEAARRCADKSGRTFEIQLGAMIETPRAALIADKLAEECDFFSFGTNDLTQMVFGISRDTEASGVIANYVENEILTQNPFETLDIDGVGRLMEFAAKAGKHTKPRLKLAICGKQASDGRSIDFCHRIGMSYISCLPGMVPAAKLAAAQAAARNEVRQI